MKQTDRGGGIGRGLVHRKVYAVEAERPVTVVSEGPRGAQLRSRVSRGIQSQSCAATRAVPRLKQKVNSKTHTQGRQEGVLGWRQRGGSNSREVHEVAGVADGGVHQEGQVREQAEPFEEVRGVHAHVAQSFAPTRNETDSDDV